jgi:hypothetical protein
MKRLVLGLAVVAAYVTVAVLFNVPGAPRPLFDGLAPPQQYRYVDPPKDLADSNEPPGDGRGVIDIVGGKSAPSTISTSDGQLQVVFAETAFASRKGEKRIQIEIDPSSPAPPLDLEGGLRIDGNAYRVTATYAKSAAPAIPKLAATIVIRYPVVASVVARREGAGWRKLKTQISEASLQLFAQTNQLGTFAAAGKPHRSRTWWLPYAAGVAGVIAGIGGYLWGRRSGRRRPKKKRPRTAKPR